MNTHKPNCQMSSMGWAASIPPECTCAPKEVKCCSKCAFHTYKAWNNIKGECQNPSCPCHSPSDAGTLTHTTSGKGRLYLEENMSYEGVKKAGEQSGWYELNPPRTDAGVNPFDLGASSPSNGRVVNANSNTIEPLTNPPPTESWAERFFEGAILFKGKWVTWEFYKDLHGIQEFGHYGDAINGDTVHLRKYKEYFDKEFASFIRTERESYQKELVEAVEWEKKSLNSLFSVEEIGAYNQALDNAIALIRSLN